MTIYLKPITGHLWFVLIVDKYTDSMKTTQFFKYIRIYTVVTVCNEYSAILLIVATKFGSQEWSHCLSQPITGSLMCAQNSHQLSSAC